MEKIIKQGKWNGRDVIKSGEGSDWWQFYLNNYKSYKSSLSMPLKQRFTENGANDDTE